METMKMYRVEIERHMWEGIELKDVMNIGNSFYTTVEAARKHAERAHADGMRIHRETASESETVTTEIWVTEYQLMGNEFLYVGLAGHFTSSDYNADVTGILFSHCK